MRYPCPCCGYLVFSEPLGSYAICPICFWEDDALQLEYPYEGGGPNHLSLAQSQSNYASFGACELRLLDYVRPPLAAETQAEGWRPIEQVADVIPADERLHEWQQRPNPDRYYWRWNHTAVLRKNLLDVRVQRLLQQGPTAIAAYVADAVAGKRLGALGYTCFQLGRMSGTHAIANRDLHWAATALDVYALIAAYAHYAAPRWKGQYEAMLLRRDMINAMGPLSADPVLDINVIVEWFHTTFPPLDEMQRLVDNHGRLHGEEHRMYAHLPLALHTFTMNGATLTDLLQLFPALPAWQILST